MSVKMVVEDAGLYCQMLRLGPRGRTGSAAARTDVEMAPSLVNGCAKIDASARSTPPTLQSQRSVQGMPPRQRQVQRAPFLKEEPVLIDVVIQIRNVGHDFSQLLSITKRHWKRIVWTVVVPVQLR
jgi:hypothetical protein